MTAASPDPRRRPRRQGPRPLATHLAAGLGMLLSSPTGLPFLRNGSLPWRPSLLDRAMSLQASLAGVPEDECGTAVDREMRRRVDGFLTGIERYRSHPYHRDVEDPEPVWREGRSRLLGFGGAGRTVLFVPSLVNRGYILDLSARKTLLRWMAGHGTRPFLLDWGAPGPVERGFTLTDIVAGRLSRAIAAVRDATGGERPVLAGYCMGGNLALAAALRQPAEVSALALLATPWDFHADDPAGARRTAALLGPFEPALRVLGELPVDAIQYLFATLDPLLALKKFSRFAALDPDSDQAREFVALEDWLNDGVALPAAVARECLAGWYGRNDTAAGRWSIAGEAMRPERLNLPTLVMVPAKDRIVPPASAAALGQAIPGAVTRHPPLGHIGMIVSAGAEEKVWRPLLEWITAL